MTLQEKIKELQAMLADKSRQLDDEIESLQYESQILTDAADSDPEELQLLLEQLRDVRWLGLSNNKIDLLLKEVCKEIGDLIAPDKNQMNLEEIEE